MENYLNCKKIETAISRAKKALIKVAQTTGIYENFGQDEVRKITDKFIDLSDYTIEMNKKRAALQSFDHWCSNYTN